MPSLPGLRLALALCLITTAVNLQAPYYDALATHDGLGVTATSIAFACYVLGILPVLLLGNGLPDRFGRRSLIAAALGLCLVATLLTWLAPGVITLAVARFLMGIATALTSASAPAYMLSLFSGRDTRRPTAWVTTSTSLGFGLGAALTSLCLLYEPSLAPPSLWWYLCAASLALLGLWRLEDGTSHPPTPVRLRLPTYPAGGVTFGVAILLAWATVGLVIALLPGVLARHGLSAWSGFATLGVCSGGVLFQPLARRLAPVVSVRLGLVILPLAYALIAWGALNGQLPAVLLGAVGASSACYGFIYLGGLSGVLEAAGDQPDRASAGFFLLAYIGFSVPVVVTGALMEHLGQHDALIAFGIALLITSLAVKGRLWQQGRRASPLA
ncbi:MFS transporter [Billgrantia gudaonensis]|uniref:Predicted arabinose efflux permease, MFS family n=1 Tax=Billgrantia gudaonensis TaxID=376427 RepID=A0A1G8MVL9_9GAMM|nr:MFS transporter [Halomonas gudaonensis]SDI71923.1 Predicted arabinose efflux permease, MFS family [Halomonas gudaonensis]